MTTLALLACSSLYLDKAFSYHALKFNGARNVCFAVSTVLAVCAGWNL